MHNPDCLIRISNVDTFNFLLNPLFFGYSTENQKSLFLNLRVRPYRLLILILIKCEKSIKWCAKFLISRLLIRPCDWRNFIYFLGYKHKIRLVSRLRKREDQALISLSTVLKFPTFCDETVDVWIYYCFICVIHILDVLDLFLQT